jgi:hypothetical protein
MLIGVLCGNSLREYHEMSGASPIPIIKPALLYISYPDALRGNSGSPLEGCIVEATPRMFRHVYNPATRRTSFYAGVSGINIEGNSSIGSIPYTPEGDFPFVPHFKIAEDGMQSKSSRSFLKSFSDSLAKRVFTFEVFVANKEDHTILFEDFNSEASRELADVSLYANTLT